MSNPNDESFFLGNGDETENPDESEDKMNAHLGYRFNQIQPSEIDLVNEQADAEEEPEVIEEVQEEVQDAEDGFNRSPEVVQIFHLNNM